MKFSLIFSFVEPPPGSSLTQRDTIREFREVVPFAEDLGYHSIQTVEHHFQHDGYVPSPLLMLSVAAGLTKRVRLATNILLTPLYAPVQLLEDLATLDNISDGRITIGSSPGYVKEEFAGRGVSFEDRFKLHECIIDFIQHAWVSPDDIGFQCQFFNVPSLKLRPKPVQPTLPIWYGVSGPKLLEKAARRRVPVTASPRHTTAALQEHFARYTEIAREIGYVPTERPIMRDTLVLDTVAEAERLGAPATAALFGIYGRKSAEGGRPLHTDDGQLVTDEAMVNFREMSSRYIVGDPELAKERVRELRDALNPSEIVLRMQMPGITTEVLRHSMRLFAEKVMPEFS